MFLKRYNNSVPNEPWAICDRCGFKVPFSETRKEWTGLRVCKDDFEERHPQDFVRGRKEDIAVKDARPRPDYVYIDVGDVTPESL